MPRATAGSRRALLERRRVEFTLDLMRGRMAGRRHGPPGEPFLGLHGWMDNAATFDRLAPLLPDLDLAALDLPGHGLSDWRPPGAPYHYLDWLGDVVDAADALGWPRFGILGHSMGAGLAPLLAAALPERVTHLLLVEGLGPMTEPPSAVPARLGKALRERALFRRPGAVHPSREAAVQARLRSSPLEPESASILVDRVLEEVEGGFRFRHDPRLREPSWVRLVEDQVRELLRAVACPVLFLRGERGLPVDPALLRGRLECLRDVEVVTLAGGHHLHLDAPEPVANAIRDFLKIGT